MRQHSSVWVLVQYIISPAELRGGKPRERTIRIWFQSSMREILESKATQTESDWGVVQMRGLTDRSFG